MRNAIQLINAMEWVMALTKTDMQDVFGYVTGTGIYATRLQHEGFEQFLQNLELHDAELVFNSMQRYLGLK